MLPEAEKFDGTGWPAWKTKISAHIKAHGLGGYIDGTIPNPSPTPIDGAEAAGAHITHAPPADTALPPEPTVVYFRNPLSDEWSYRDGITTSILVLNVKDPVGVGLKTDGSTYEAWRSLKEIYARQTDMAISRALCELNTTYFVSGMSVVDHAAVMRKLQRAANDVGTAITNGVFRMTFIASLGESWRHVTPVLRTYMMSVEVINFLIDFLIEEEQIHNANIVPVPTTALAMTSSQFPSCNAHKAARKALVCTNPTCGAQGKKGHTIEECFWPGGGKARILTLFHANWPTSHRMPSRHTRRSSRPKRGIN
jgi:hypothetical protein